MTFGQVLSEKALVRVRRKAEVVALHCWKKHWKAAPAKAAKQDTEVTQ